MKRQINPDGSVTLKRSEPAGVQKPLGKYPARASEAKESGKENAGPEKHEKGYYKTHACNETFICKNCGCEVVPEGAASEHRNHCPKCLYSLHVDIEPGDRASECHGKMEPIAVWVRNNGEWAIIHRCKTCGALSSNRVAADDNPLKLMAIAVKPLANPPFPLERIEDLAGLTGNSEK